MRAIPLLLSLACAAALAGADKKAPASGRGETETITVNATVFTDREAIKQRLGSDLDGHYIVVDVRISSRFGREIDVHRDDFLLRTDKDGEKSTPFAPSQIAGKGALVVSQTSRGGAMMGDNNGPVWGGYGTDRPRRMGGDGGAIGGGDGGTEARAAVRSGEGEKTDPLKALLEEKILPEKKTTESLTGLLYFPLEKQKFKDLELIYTAPDGRISVRFRQ